MIRVFGFAAVVLCLISLLLLGAMTLVAPYISPTAEMASARMLQNSSNWFQILDLERAMSVRIGVSLDDEIRDVRLMWNDGKYAYFWTWREEEDTNQPLFTYHLYDLSTGQVTPLVQDVKTEERDIIMQSFISPSPDGRHLSLFRFTQRDYYVIDTATQKLHLLMDFEPVDRTGQTTIISLPWSPTNEHLAFTHENMLYLVDLPETTVHEFKIAEEGIFFPQWSKEGKQILLSPYRTQQPVRIFDMTTRTFDPRVPKADVNWVSWGCDDQSLIYNRPLGDPDEDEAGQIDLFNLQTGATMSINDLPGFADKPLASALALDCEHLLVAGIAAQPPSQSDAVEERPLYILNLTTETIITVDERAAYLGWIDEEDAMVYSKAVQRQPRHREVFKRAAKVDSQPERLGAYEALVQGSVMLSSDYSTLVQWGYRSGRLTMGNLRTGYVSRLAVQGETVEEFAVWQ